MVCSLLGFNNALIWSFPLYFVYNFNRTKNRNKTSHHRKKIADKCVSHAFISSNCTLSNQTIFIFHINIFMNIYVSHAQTQMPTLYLITLKYRQFIFKIWVYISSFNNFFSLNKQINLKVWNSLGYSYIYLVFKVKWKPLELEKRSTFLKDKDAICFEWLVFNLYFHPNI